MYKGETAERDILGTKATVRAIARDSLVSYRDSQYTGPNTIVTIAGGIPADAMLSWASRAFSQMPNREARPRFPTYDKVQTGPETVFVEKDTDQAHLVMAWRTFNREHPDIYVAGLIQRILRGGMSSRLFMRLREEMGAGYYIGANNALLSTFGRFTVSTGTTPERVPEIVAAIRSEIGRLKSELLSPAELSKVKEQRRASMLMSLETSDDVADFYADQDIYYGCIKTPQELDAIYSRITAEDIKRVANVMFDDMKLTVAAIGKGIDKEAVAQVLGI
jgi:predicted Zn-dependent peptidase